MFEHTENIKQHYQEILPRIMSRNKGQWVSPYTDLVRWELLFSPIEEQTWHALRSFGQCPLYPQYPANKYFLDFGNPKYKVAIECDGKEWHLDKEKDAKRDKELLKDFGHIYRISGADCFRICERYYELQDYNEFDDDEKGYILREYYTTIEGLIKSIAIFYFGYKDYYLFEIEIDIAIQTLGRCASPIQKDIIMDNLWERAERIKTEYYNWKEQNT